MAAVDGPPVAAVGGGGGGDEAGDGAGVLKVVEETQHGRCSVECGEAVG